MAYRAVSSVPEWEKVYRGRFCTTGCI